jgi:tripartite-type tricarboxylate transporter receptor subunit TctC
MALSRRRFHQSTIAAALVPSMTAFAQTSSNGPGGYPDKIIKIIVPYPAGGVVDIVIRAAADPASAMLPQRIVVENRTGADGRIGLDAVAKSAPDGYTLLAATPLVSVGEHLMTDMKGRAQDFKGIVAIASPASVFVVPATLDVKTLKDFIALAASKPNELNVANPGSGSSIHLAQELLFDLANIKLINVNYKGQPPALLDMASGQVQFGLISQNLVLPLIKSGKLKALAVNAAKRTKSLPDVPTIAEAGFPDALVQAWYGIAAPAKTPQPILNYLIEQFQKVMNLPETKTKLDALDAEILAYNGPKFDALIESEFKRWGELIRKRKIVAAALKSSTANVS